MGTALFIFLLFLTSCQTEPPPEAQHGILDLSEQDPSEFGPIMLRGDWNVYWERFIDPPARVDELPTGADTFKMPHSWNGWQFDGTPVGGEGFASFTLEVLLPEGLDQVGLWIPNASTAYELFVNGHTLASSGEPGINRSSSVPHYRINKVTAPVQDDRILITLHVSNFHHRRGGMWKSLRLGSVGQIETLNTIETMYDFLLLGNFLALSFYNFFLYLTSRKKPLVSLLLSIFFGVLGLRVLVLGQMLITQLFVGFPWAVQLKIEYLTSHAIPTLIVWIIDRLYPGKLDRRITLAITWFVAFNTAIMLVTPVLFYSKIVFIYLIGLLCGLAAATIQFIVNLVRGDKSALIMIGVIALILFVVFGDSVHNWELILSRDFAPFGFMVSLFSRGSNVQTSAYLFSTLLTVLIFFITANLLALIASRKALAVHEKNQHVFEWDHLHRDFKITKRESELLSLVMQGLSNKEIGEKLFISEGTVKNHLHHIMRKLKVRNRTELSMKVRGS
jgi:DNA-binding CsgD family transcriptional regulator